MADALYVKTASGVEPVELSSGVSSLTVTRERLALDSVLSAGAPYEVPEHPVGGTDLVVTFNGVLCVLGEQYIDESSTSISFTFDLPAGSEVDAISFEGGISAISKALS